MNLKIAVLSGDGIGPEVTLQAKKVLQAIAFVHKHEFIFEDALIGAIAIEKTGKPLPEQTLNLCKNTDSILFGAIGDPKYDSDPTSKYVQSKDYFSFERSRVYLQILDQLKHIRS